MAHPGQLVADLGRIRVEFGPLKQHFGGGLRFLVQAQHLGPPQPGVEFVIAQVYRLLEGVVGLVQVAQALVDHPAALPVGGVFPIDIDGLVDVFTGLGKLFLADIEISDSQPPLVEEGVFVHGQVVVMAGLVVFAQLFVAPPDAQVGVGGGVVHLDGGGVILDGFPVTAELFEHPSFFEIGADERFV